MYYTRNLKLKDIEDSDALIWKEEQLKLDLKKIDLFAYLEVSITRFENLYNEGHIACLLFRSPHFLFLVFGHFWKIRKYYVIFDYILQGKMDKMRKKEKKITQRNWPKYQKPNDENMGWTKHISQIFYLILGTIPISRTLCIHVSVNWWALITHLNFFFQR